MRTDVANNELNIGDEVWIVSSYFQLLLRAHITGFTPKMITVKLLNRVRTKNVNQACIIKSPHDGTKSTK